MRIKAMVIGLLLTFLSGAAHACGMNSDCPVEGGGSYRIYGPQKVSEPGAAILFMHGWQATAGAMLKNKALVSLADRLGVILVAPNGEGKTWSFPGSPSAHRDELAYFDRLMRTLAERHGIKAEKTMASGFSMGGSMVWHLACERGDRFLGFAPIAGTYWDPLPEQCSTRPRWLLHVHGTSDTVVPIKGRLLRDTWRQGDVDAGFAFFTANAPIIATDEALPKMACSHWLRENQTFRFCRHQGGHIYKAEWVEEAWRTMHADPQG
ncbi:MAG: alpha/beta hydrolase-fold protein [Neomegalonema sp.]|nr:alpha/beta hydrolase-fold protein [Neomegalonema sp.]